jgi:DNA-binding response OmpR family regulator
MAIQSFIVEDDSMSLKVLERMVNQREELELVGKAQTADKALDLLAKQEIELLFLDIGIGEDNGLDLIQQLPTNPVIILTTSYTDYALQAFEYGVTDYILKPFKHDRFHKAVAKAIEQIRLYRGAELDYGESAILRTLRFMYTRNISVLKPEIDRHSQVGYSFPLLSLQYSHNETYKLLDALDEAEEKDLLTGHFFETFYLCPECFEGFLQYREVCPNCESPNLMSEDLIHHFPCAYIGPGSDFKTDRNANMLVCPKCDQYLKHIGVDYDKPSLIYTCQHCYNRVQDVMAHAKCLSCGSDRAVEQLDKRTIREYELTAKGAEAPRNTQLLIDNDSESLKEATRLVDLETFDLMLNYEVKRRKATSLEAHIGGLRLVKRDENEPLTAEEIHYFQEQALKLFKGLSKPEDVITYWDSSSFLFSLLGPESGEARKITRTLQQNIDKTLKIQFPERSLHVHHGYSIIQSNVKPEQVKSETLGQLDAV